MKISTQREIEDPKNFARAYSYDPKTGFYTGLVNKQENPRVPGQFLMPAFSVDIKPPFKEGMRAKWAGDSWSLVDRKQAIAADALVKKTVEQARDVVFDQIKDVLIALIQSEIQKVKNETRDYTLSLIEERLKDASSHLAGESQAFIKQMVESEVTKITAIGHALVQDVTEIESRAHDVHAQTLEAAQEVQMNVEVIREQVRKEVADVQKWWQFWKDSKKGSEAKPEAEGGA